MYKNTFKAAATSIIKVSVPIEHNVTINPIILKIKTFDLKKNPINPIIILLVKPATTDKRML